MYEHDYIMNESVPNHSKHFNHSKYSKYSKHSKHSNHPNKSFQDGGTPTAVLISTRLFRTMRLTRMTRMFMTGMRNYRI